MIRTSPSFRFLRAVHRRLIVVRALEHGGICAAVGAGFALVFTGAMLWRGDDGLPIAVGTIAAGGVIGLVWGFVRRPGIADAALAVDRQLDLADLLATALSLGSNDDPWARAVVAVADDRCRSLSADAVIVRRLGGRAWGGIGLAAALVLTLGALSTLPTDSRARTDRGSDVEVELAQPRDAASARATGDDGGMRDSRAERKSVGGIEPDDEGADARATPALSPPDATATPHPVAANGTGTGNMPAAQPAERLTASAAGSGGEPGGNASAGGAAGAEPPTQTSTGPAGIHAGAQAGRDVAPPWQSPSWGLDGQTALREVQNGRVPAGYGDVVKEYFREGER